MPATHTGHHPHRGPAIRRPSLALSFAICTGLAVSSCGPAGFSPLLLPRNFHVVDEGRLYRSGQPDAARLATAIDQYGIRTVLNLRGRNVGRDWYDAETRVCQEKGVAHVDYAMSNRDWPTLDMLKAVIETLRTAEYPMLIHCEGGADRTGVVSAIYRMAVLGNPKPEALHELSIEHFHFRAIAPCMDTLAEAFEDSPAFYDQYDQLKSQPCH